MVDSEKEFIENQSQYIDLLNRLTQLYLAGQQPSDELIKQAKKLGQAAQIPDFLLRLIYLIFDLIIVTLQINCNGPVKTESRLPKISLKNLKTLLSRERAPDTSLA